MDLNQLPYSVPSQTDFDKAFMNSLDPAYAAMLRMPATTWTEIQQRQVQANILAQKGLLIDEGLVIPADPYWLTVQRIIDGYVDSKTGKGWTVALFGPEIELGPGITFPGVTNTYDPTKPPAAHILVSLDLTDLPPFQSPAVTPPPVPTQDLVGDDLGFMEPYTFPMNWTGADGTVTPAGATKNLEVYRQLVSAGVYNEGQTTKKSDGKMFVYHFIGNVNNTPISHLRLGTWLLLP